MPEGVDKATFKKFTKYYEKDIFVAAGLKIRANCKNSDNLDPTERVNRIARLFATFKNPDRETVLTPWPVVNKHMSDCLGGYVFEGELNLDQPEYVTRGEVTNNTLSNVDANILEINSKSGLYPLYVAYSLYRAKCGKKYDTMTTDQRVKVWDDVIENNLFVLCKTPMAVSITKRTLAGYRNAKCNVKYIPDLVNSVKDDATSEKLIKTICKGKSFWQNKNKDDNIRFNAVVGNPPYQETVGSTTNASLGKQLYPDFIKLAIKLKPDYSSLITPSRWFTADAQDRSFPDLREYVKKNNHFVKIFTYDDAKEVFPTAIIKGGVNYFLFSRDYTGPVEFIDRTGGADNRQTRQLFEEGLDVILSSYIQSEMIKKVRNSDDFTSIMCITTGRNAFGIVGKQDIVDKISGPNKTYGPVKLVCMKKEIRWTKSENITKGHAIANSYKVFISKSAGDPAKDRKVIGTPYVAGPNEVCTDSLIPIGAFNSIEEAQNLAKYLQTKFVRYLISILKKSQNVYQNVYEFVPLQDFSNDSDIKWNTIIPDIDVQLYKKYGFTDEEIAEIDSTVDYVSPGSKSE